MSDLMDELLMFSRNAPPWAKRRYGELRATLTVRAALDQVCREANAPRPASPRLSPPGGTA